MILSSVGVDVGLTVGALEGALVVGSSVGLDVGTLDGALVVGEVVGTSVVGSSEGFDVGSLVGVIVVGEIVGWKEKNTQEMHCFETLFEINSLTNVWLTITLTSLVVGCG